jgi:hypothetical protein
MRANCFVLAAAASFAFTGAFAQNETDRFFDKVKPQSTAVTDCYRRSANDLIPTMAIIRASMIREAVSDTYIDLALLQRGPISRSRHVEFIFGRIGRGLQFGGGAFAASDQRSLLGSLLGG